jgi:hypothetical protein
MLTPAFYFVTGLVLVAMQKVVVDDPSFLKKAYRSAFAIPLWLVHHSYRKIPFKKRIHQVFRAVSLRKLVITLKKEYREVSLFKD